MHRYCNLLLAVFSGLVVLSATVWATPPEKNGAHATSAKASHQYLPEIRDSVLNTDAAPLALRPITGVTTVSRQDIQAQLLNTVLPSQSPAVLPALLQKAMPEAPPDRVTHVHWEGKLVHWRYRQHAKRWEAMVKVLPDAALYDTVLMIEGLDNGDALQRQLPPGKRIQFNGELLYATNWALFKLVHVRIARPQDIRRVGQ